MNLKREREVQHLQENLPSTSVGSRNKTSEDFQLLIDTQIHLILRIARSLLGIEMFTNAKLKETFPNDKFPGGPEQICDFMHIPTSLRARLKATYKAYIFQRMDYSVLKNSLEGDAYERVLQQYVAQCLGSEIKNYEALKHILDAPYFRESFDRATDDKITTLLKKPEVVLFEPFQSLDGVILQGTQNRYCLDPLLKKLYRCLLIKGVLKRHNAKGDPLKLKDSDLEYLSNTWNIYDDEITTLLILLQSGPENLAETYKTEKAGINHNPTPQDIARLISRLFAQSPLFNTKGGTLEIPFQQMNLSLDQMNKLSRDIFRAFPDVGYFSHQMQFDPGDARQVSNLIISIIRPGFPLHPLVRETPNSTIDNNPQERPNPQQEILSSTKVGSGNKTPEDFQMLIDDQIRVILRIARSLLGIEVFTNAKLKEIFPNEKFPGDPEQICGPDHILAHLKATYNAHIFQRIEYSVLKNSLEGDAYERVLQLYVKNCLGNDIQNFEALQRILEGEYFRETFSNKDDEISILLKKPEGALKDPLQSLDGVILQGTKNRYCLDPLLKKLYRCLLIKKVLERHNAAEDLLKLSDSDLEDLSKTWNTYVGELKTLLSFLQFGTEKLEEHYRTEKTGINHNPTPQYIASLIMVQFAQSPLFSTYGGRLEIPFQRMALSRDQMTELSREIFEVLLPPLLPPEAKKFDYLMRFIPGNARQVSNLIISIYRPDLLLQPLVRVNPNFSIDNNLQVRPTPQNALEMDQPQNNFPPFSELSRKEFPELTTFPEAFVRLNSYTIRDPFDVQASYQELHDLIELFCADPKYLSSQSNTERLRGYLDIIDLHIHHNRADAAVTTIKNFISDLYGLIQLGDIVTEEDIESDPIFQERPAPQNVLERDQPQNNFPPFSDLLLEKFPKLTTFPEAFVRLNSYTIRDPFDVQASYQELHDLMERSYADVEYLPSQSITEILGEYLGLIVSVIQNNNVNAAAPTIKTLISDLKGLIQLGDIVTEEDIESDPIFTLKPWITRWLGDFANFKNYGTAVSLFMPDNNLKEYSLFQRFFYFLLGQKSFRYLKTSSELMKRKIKALERPVDNHPFFAEKTFFRMIGYGATYVLFLIPTIVFYVLGILLVDRPLAFLKGLVTLPGRILLSMINLIPDGKFRKSLALIPLLANAGLSTAFYLGIRIPSYLLSIPVRAAITAAVTAVVGCGYSLYMIAYAVGFVIAKIVTLSIEGVTALFHGIMKYFFPDKIENGTRADEQEVIAVTSTGSSDTRQADASDIARQLSVVDNSDDRTEEEIEESDAVNIDLRNQYASSYVPLPLTSGGIGRYIDIDAADSTPETTQSFPTTMDSIARGNTNDDRADQVSPLSH